VTIRSFGIGRVRCLGDDSPQGTERELVIAAEDGDAAACRQLVDAFLPAIADLAPSFQGSRIEQLVLAGYWSWSGIASASAARLGAAANGSAKYWVSWVTRPSLSSITLTE
jgi:hypothetical protein